MECKTEHFYFLGFQLNFAASSSELLELKRKEGKKNILKQSEKSLHRGLQFLVQKK